MNELSTLSRNFVSQFGGTGLMGGDLDWLASLRKAGAERFSAAGLPTPKLEDWKYTSLKTLEALDFAPASASGPEISIDQARSLLGEGGHRLVFVNGCFRAELSDVADLPAGVRVSNLAAALGRDGTEIGGTLGDIAAPDDWPPFLALNTALMGDGFVIELDAGAAVERPIEIISIGCADGAPRAFHPRNLIIAGDGARATIVEHHYGLDGGAYLANAVTEIAAGNGAAILHLRLFDDSSAAFNLSAVHARLGKDSSYQCFTGTRGGRLTRSDIHVVLGAPGAECRLDGVYLGRGSVHIDNLTLVEHAAAHTVSRQTYKGALGGKSRGVFRGCILVHPNAQKTDGQLINKTLLLSDEAEIDSKPELLIFADDVKCGHGATVGEIDADQLFYLQARGIPEAAARRILIEAFLGEVIDAIAIDEFKQSIGGLFATEETGAGQ